MSEYNNNSISSFLNGSENLYQSQRKPEIQKFEIDNIDLKTKAF